MIRYDKRKAMIGKRILKEREILGLSRKELLPKIFMSEQSHKTVSAWEDGKRMPDLESLARMAELFECDVGYLLCDYDERTRDIADAKVTTGLEAEAIDALIELNNSASYTRKFRQDVISYFLASDIFWNETIKHIQSAYQLRKGALEEIKDEDLRKSAEDAATILGALNLGGYTKHVVWDGKFSADMQIRFAANSTEKLFALIVNRILETEQGGGNDG